MGNFLVGVIEGRLDGLLDDEEVRVLGDREGPREGDACMRDAGDLVGRLEGVADGLTEGRKEALEEGLEVGREVGLREGLIVVLAVGLFVGLEVLCCGVGEGGRKEEGLRVRQRTIKTKVTRRTLIIGF